MSWYEQGCEEIAEHYVERVPISQPPEMSPVFEAGGRLPAPAPNAEYIVFGWRVMIVYSEKCIAHCENA